MSKKTKVLIIGLLSIIIIGISVFLFVFGSGTGSVKKGNREMPEANGTSGEITKGLVVRQDFINGTDDIKEVALVFHRLYDLEGSDADTSICLELSSEGQVLASTLVKANDIPEQHRVYLIADSPISGYVGKELTLKIYETNNSDTGVSLLTSSSGNEVYYFGNSRVDGSICFSVTGK